jgi:hypothetical protein
MALRHAGTTLTLTLFLLAALLGTSPRAERMG